MERMRRWGWHGIAVALALAAAVWLVLGTSGTSESVSTSSDGTVTRTVSQTTLLQTEGWSVLIVLALPVLLTALPLLVLHRHRRRVAEVSVVLLGVLVFLAMFSVGVFFLPAFIATVVAAARSRSSRQPAPQV
jgi:cytochrome bd-type quinol oxidase subunit 2